MKTNAILPSAFFLLALLVGCASEIKAPPDEFPVFGPYMTKDGNMLRNPLGWSGNAKRSDPALAWDAAKGAWALVASGSAVHVHHHHLLNELFYSSSCRKTAIEPLAGKDGAFGDVLAPEFALGADGVWRLYASACTSSDPASRRLAVFKATQEGAWSPYAFEGWLLKDVPATDPTVFAWRGRKYLASCEGGAIALRELTGTLAVGKEVCKIAVPGGATSPFAVVGANGRLFLGYTADGGRGAPAASSEIRVLSLAGTDPFDGRAWKPLAKPLLAPGNGFLNPRGGSSCLSPDGRETWLAYNVSEDLGGKPGDTLVCFEKIVFDAAGNPALGIPAKADLWRTCPSGEPPHQVVR